MPMLPWVSWPSRQQPCSMPRSFCAQRSAGNGGGGGGGGALATGGGFGGSTGLGGSIGLHRATFFLMSASSAASSAASFLPSASLLSSEAFRMGVGSGGASGAGGAGVSSMERLVDGSTGAQARRNHETINRARISSRPISSAASQRGQPSRERGFIARRRFASAELTPSSREGGSDQSAASAFFGPSAAGKMTRSSVRQ